MFIAQHEQVLHLDDFILRRSLLAMLGRCSLDLLDELAAVLAEALDWSAEQTAAEVERSVHTLETRHLVRLRAAESEQA